MLIPHFCDRNNCIHCMNGNCNFFVGDLYFLDCLKNGTMFHSNIELKTDKDRSDYVSRKFFKCIQSCAGLTVGEHYWFEYTGDGFYTILSDPRHYERVYITDNELLKNFSVDNG